VTGGACVDGQCAQPTCDDGLANGLETDVDCGGGTCDPCTEGKACGHSSDCEGSVPCQSGLCAPSDWYEWAHWPLDRADYGYSYTAASVTVTDEMTGLMWEREATAYGKETWERSAARCADSTFAGYDDWRLPTLIELASLIEWESTGLLLNMGAFSPDFTSLGPETNPKFWTATPGVGTGRQWLDFRFGTSAEVNTSTVAWSRCVR
jgi:hypothetical protein